MTEFFLTSEDCARCGSHAGEHVFCHPCVIEGQEFHMLTRR